MEEVIQEINEFLKKHNWCDFSIINLDFNLEIGGTTSFSEVPDIKIFFNDVFFIQCLNEWKTDTSKDAFFKGNDEDENYCFSNYEIEQGYYLFKILAENARKPIYIIARDLKCEIIKKSTSL